MNKLIKCCLLIFFFSIGLLLHSQTKSLNLVKDLNTLGFGTLGGNYTQVGNEVFFIATDAFGIRALWKSDGTDSGTIVVREANSTDFGLTYVSLLTNVNGKLFFINQSRLWKSDGTESGTVVVDSNLRFSNAKYPSQMISIQDTAYFISGNSTIWRSDGTASGTFILKSFDRLNERIHSDLIKVGNEFYFTANDSIHGTELWKSDGTSAGTKIVNEFIGNNYGFQLLASSVDNGKLYYLLKNVPQNFSSRGIELWVSDGSDTGTYKMTTVTKNYRNQHINGDNYTMVANNDTIYFRRNDTLWMSNGTDTGTFIIEKAKEMLYPSPLLIHNDRLYFITWGSASFYALDMWTLDKSTNEPIKMKVPNGISTFTPGFRGYNASTPEHLFFHGSDDIYGNQLWKLDSSGLGVERVTSIEQAKRSWVGSAPGNPNYTQQLIPVGNRVFFKGSDSLHGAELWTSDGTPEGTNMVIDIDQRNHSTHFAAKFTLNNKMYLSAQELYVHQDTDKEPVALHESKSYIGPVVRANDSLFFLAWNDSIGQALYRSDDTKEGTEVFLNLDNNIARSNIRNKFTTVGDKFYFVYDTPSVTTSELWVSDGTKAGTKSIYKYFPYMPGSSTNMLEFKGKLFFAGGSFGGGTGMELFSSDGTKTGTSIVKDITVSPTSSHSSFPENFTVVDSTLFFMAKEFIYKPHKALWKTDGTGVGTEEVAEIRPLDNTMRNINGVLYFLASDDYSRVSGLWKSDGTDTGTVLVKSIPESEMLLTSNYIETLDDTIYFSTRNKIWKTDGTDSLVEVLEEFNAQFFSGFPEELTKIGDTIFFIAANNPVDKGVWFIDGLTGNVEKLTDTYPADFSKPHSLIKLNHSLYFEAFTLMESNELWRYGPCGIYDTTVVVACDSFTWQNGITYYSNDSVVDTLRSTLGCDSIVTLLLTINHSNYAVDSVTACNQYTWINGQTYHTSNNTSKDTLIAANGCDSIVSLFLTINHSSFDVDSITTCNNYTWINGQTYDSTNNTAKDTLIAANGCDSIIQLNLTILPSSSSTDTLVACDSLKWIDGTTYTQSNSSSTDTLTNSLGCDSIVYLNLTITKVDTSVLQSKDSLIALADSVTYQWLDCNLNFAAVPGATSKVYVSSFDGSFSVEITDGACKDTSSCFVTTVGFLENHISNRIEVFPNPTNGNLKITSEGVTLKEVEILDLKGNQIEKLGANIKDVSIEHLPTGIYILRLITNEGIGYKKISKL